MLKTYKSFGSRDTRNAVFCKSEINLTLLKEMGLDSLVTVKEAKEIFDDIYDSDGAFIMYMGHPFDKKKKRHVKFVWKKFFKDEVSKHLFH